MLTAVQGVLSDYSSSKTFLPPEEIKKAKRNLFDFIVSGRGEIVLGPLTNLKSDLTLIPYMNLSEIKNFQETKNIFISIIDVGITMGFVEKKTREIFFKETLNQKSFIDDLVTGILEYGVLTPITVDTIAKVQSKLIGLLDSELGIKIVKKLSLAGQEFSLETADGLEMYVVCNLIIELEECKLINVNDSRIFFAREFNKNPCIEKVKQLLGTSCQK